MPLGTKSQFGYAFETVAHGQMGATFNGLRNASIKFLPGIKTDRTRNQQGRPQQPKAHIVEVGLPFEIDCDPSVDDLARIRAHHQGFASIATTATGVRTWSIRDFVDGDSLASDISRMSIVAGRDDGYGTLLLNAAITDMDLKVERGKLVNCKFSGRACEYTHMADPVVSTTGGTYTGKLYVRRNRKGADAEDTTNDLKAKITTGGALDGTAQVKFTRGTDLYGSVAYPVVAGVWMDVLLANGLHASGDPLDPVQVMFSTGGTLSLNDEWTIDAKRAAASLSYPARQPLRGVRAIIKINGTEFPYDTFDLSFTRPMLERRSGSSLYPIGLLMDDGPRLPVIKIARPYVDRQMYRMMQSLETISFEIVIHGDLIATVTNVSYYEYWKIVSANAQVLKGGADPNGGKILQETGIEIAPFFDGTTADMTEEIRCTLSTLA